MKKKTTVKGFKGLRQDLSCQPDWRVIKQYGIGKVFRETYAKVRAAGMHYSEFAIHVLQNTTSPGGPVTLKSRISPTRIPTTGVMSTPQHTSRSSKS